MKRISHYKTYNPHQFIYDKIELSEDFPTDKPDEECFRELLERIEAMAKVAYPWLFEEAKPFVSQLASAFNNLGNPYSKVEAPTFVDARHIIKPKPHEPVTEEILRECKTISDLEWWFDAIDAKNGEERTSLWNVYDEMFEKFSKEKTTA
jgi:hypothetical protein